MPDVLEIIFTKDLKYNFVDSFYSLKIFYLVKINLVNATFEVLAHKT